MDLYLVLVAPHGYSDRDYVYAKLVHAMSKEDASSQVIKWYDENLDGMDVDVLSIALADEVVIPL